MSRASAMRPVGLVAGLTWLDFMRRKDFYVVAVFMAIYVIAILAVRIIGVETADAARFLMSLGLNLAHLLAAFLAASFAARAFPEEFDRGTLAPLLAKPVSRAAVLAGKAGVCAGIACAGYLLFALATVLAVPGAPGQSVAALFQVLTLQLLSLTLLSAMATALSLYWPTVVAALVSLLWYLGAGFAIGLVRESVRAHAREWAGATQHALACLPDPTLLSHIEVYAQGATLMPWRVWSALVLYAAFWTVAFAVWAGWRFRRMRI